MDHYHSFGHRWAVSSTIHGIFIGDVILTRWLISVYIGQYKCILVSVSVYWSVSETG